MPGLIVHAEKASCPLCNPGTSTDPVLSSDFSSLPVQPGTRKSEKGRDKRVQSELLHPYSGCGTQRQVPSCALQRGATTEAPVQANPAAAGTLSPGGLVLYCRYSLPEVILPPDQPGWKISFRIIE